MVETIIAMLITISAAGDVEVHHVGRVESMEVCENMSRLADLDKDHAFQVVCMVKHERAF